MWSRSYAADSLGYGKKEDALPLYVLSQILAGGRTSRFYQSLAIEQKLVTQVDADYNAFSIGPSDFSFTLVPEDGVALDKLETALDKELAKLLEGGINAAELTRAKTQLKAMSLFERDGLAEMANSMGWALVAGLDISYFTQWSQKIDAVTPEQILAAAHNALQLQRSVTAELLPESAEAKP